MSVHIFNGSLDMCPTMHPTLLIATVDHLQHIRRVCWYFPALCICSVSSMNRIHSFINVLASNHSVKFVNTGTGTCHSTQASTIHMNARK